MGSRQAEVWIELVPQIHITRLGLQTRGDSLHIVAEIAGATGGERLHVAASIAGEHVSQADGSARKAVVLEVPNPRRWSPADLFLYDLEVRLLRDGDEIDHVASYFALREVEIRPDLRGHLRVHPASDGGGDPRYAPAFDLYLLAAPAISSGMRFLRRK